jgi:hypothetical protein
VSFFHSDTGVERRLDIYVDYKPGSDIATVRETGTRYETVVGNTSNIFSGRIRPEKTSSAEPLVLNWI